MDFTSHKWISNLLFCWFFIGVSCNSVEKKIYVKLNYTIPCVRLLNATHQIGCQSSNAGNVGVLHVLQTEENLDWVLRSGPNPPYMVIIDTPLFTRSVMMQLKNGSSRVAGVAVVAPNTNPEKSFSPHTTCPNQNTGLYTETYDPSLANCNTTVWNPLGNGLSYEEFGFPIFSLKDDNDTRVMKQCYFDHNQAVNGSTQYPLCAMELFSHMYAVTDTATCMRRNALNFEAEPDKVCDPLGDLNIWSSTRPINNTEKGHKKWESVVIAAARLDSRSFFYDIAPGGQSAASGFVALLAAAHALRNITQETPPNRTILYTFFQGETFDYIGSSRMVYDMEQNQFPLDLDNVHSVVEVGQVGLRADSDLWLHTDPVSRKNDSINTEVQALIEKLRLAATNLSVTPVSPSFSQPLPPSSFQRFLRARPFPGVVLEDHQSQFSNRFYQSMYDNNEYLNVSYPTDLTPDQQLEFVTDTAKALTDVATLVARALYMQAGGAEDQLVDIKADPQIVTRMLYSFLVRSNNSWFQQFVPAEHASHLKDRPMNMYIGPIQQFSEPTLPVKYLLAYLTGSVVNVTQENCQNQRQDEDDKRNKHFYNYFWVQGTAPPNSTERVGFCVRSTVRHSKAVSPAFELEQYTTADYSTWTESRWKPITGRIFLVASHELEMLTLAVGIGVLLTSLFLTYAISAKADILFNSVREPTNATY
ncbi:nicastrin isoform X1 [Cynoglossus semilaevis]|uniref:Nicastrin n=1 Tax=Cynoglossus semilaevis TaxID=244447 RepID=A0A3P8X5C9_CYNSE|nr:nicastrin isoform X1 [Cynoglossus semilaevis]